MGTKINTHTHHEVSCWDEQCVAWSAEALEKYDAIMYSLLYFFFVKLHSNSMRWLFFNPYRETERKNKYFYLNGNWNLIIYFPSSFYGKLQNLFKFNKTIYIVMRCKCKKKIQE